MKKVTFKTSNLYTLKKYNDNNLNCGSYEYPTLYGIRCAILGAIIQVDGVEMAKDLFYKIKNSNIYIQYPEKYKSNGVKLKRVANKAYNSSDSEGTSTMGFREYFDISKIVIYIDDMIPNIELYLKNIDWLGTAESMVYLERIEEVDTMENVLCRWDSICDKELYEQHDWANKTNFKNVYMYSGKDKKHVHETFMSCINTINLPSNIA